MPRYKVPTPSDGVHHIDAPSGVQAKQRVAGRIRHRYPRLTIAEISAMLSSFRENPNRRGGAGRQKTYGWWEDYNL